MKNRREETRGGYHMHGASNRTRTDDPRFTRAVLYQLSYAGIPWACVSTPTDDYITWKPAAAQDENRKYGRARLPEGEP